jgi:hypothetical protein
MPDEQASQQDIHKVLFLNLVTMLSSSAMQQLGKIVNPMTGKTEVNLEGAQMTIDMLSMLKARTTGNLDEDEDKILNDLLSSLQMNYVETAQSGEDADDAEEETSGEPADEKGDGPDPKDPKFHKSYGES